MQPPFPDEFKEIIFEAQYLLVKNGYHEIIDGPAAIKSEYNNFVKQIGSGKKPEPSLFESLHKAEDLFARAASHYRADSFRTHVYLSQLATLHRILGDMTPEALIYSIHGTDIAKLKEMADEAFKEETAFFCDYFKCSEEELPHKLKQHTESLPSLNPEDTTEYLQKSGEVIRGRLSDIFSPEEIGETKFYDSEGPEGGYNEPVDIGLSRVTVRTKDRLNRIPNVLFGTLFHENLHTCGYGIQMRTQENVPENGIILLNTIQVPYQEGIADSWKAFYETKEDFIEELNLITPDYAKLSEDDLPRSGKDVNRSRAYLFLKWFDIFVKGKSPEELVPEIQFQLGVPKEDAERYINFMKKWTTYYTTYITAEGIVAPQLENAMKDGKYYERVREFASNPPADLLR